jgi:hypothetical protein
VAKAILDQNTVLPNGERLVFDMKNWCGTACCIAGWTNVLIPDDKNARQDEHDLFAADDPAQKVFSNLGNARVALANALTNAGLGVGEYPVPNGILIVDFPADSDAATSQYGKFSPPLDGIYLQVGSRPVGATVAWIKQGRPDRLSNPASAKPNTEHK